MELEVKYQGIVATTEHVEFIKKLIRENPNDSRRALSQKLCIALNWIQPNGVLRDMVCRGFMLKLESAGYIKLPEKKCNPNNPLTNRKPPKKIEVDQKLIVSRLSEIKPLEIRQVRGTSEEKFYNSLMS